MSRVVQPPDTGLPPLDQEDSWPQTRFQATTPTQKAEDLCTQ